MKRVAIYARVAICARDSTDEQSRGNSLSSQLEACRKHARERQWPVVVEVTDNGVSGATLDRPGLGRIRELAHMGEIEGLIVYTLDRLSRMTIHYRLVAEELDQAGVTVHCALHDYGDNGGQLQAIIAECERSQVRKRNIRGRKM